VRPALERLLDGGDDALLPGPDLAVREAERRRRGPPVGAPAALVLVLAQQVV
jgi:hypothetical protein